MKKMKFRIIFNWGSFILFFYLDFRLLVLFFLNVKLFGYDIKIIIKEK